MVEVMPDDAAKKAVKSGVLIVDTSIEVVAC